MLSEGVEKRAKRVRKFLATPPNRLLVRMLSINGCGLACSYLVLARTLALVVATQLPGVLVSRCQRRDSLMEVINQRVSEKLIGAR